MDFTKFDSRTPADEGRKLHIKHPVTGKPIMDGQKPCYVIVRGSEGRQVQKEMAEYRAAQAKREEAEEKGDERDLNSAHEKLVDAVAKLVVGFENVDRGDRAAKAPEDVQWFLNLQMLTEHRIEESFAQQVAKFATSRANFLAGSSRG